MDYPESIPTLVEWFQAQWPEYYAGRTPTDIAQDFREEARRDGLPVRLVAFVDGKLAGTITLREHAFQALPTYRPGLGGLLVVEQFRSRGVGTKLVRAGMLLAQEQSFTRIFTTTMTAQGILKRLGWQLIQPVSHGGEQTKLYIYELEKHDLNQY